MSPDDPLLVRKLSRRIPRAALGDFLAELRRRIAGGRELVCLITDDRELRKLNREFRGQDCATDVLSFPDDDAGVEPLPSVTARNEPRLKGAVQRRPLGEIAISVDRAAAQAVEHGHSFTNELRILMLHGALHLTGFDHERDAGEMERAELRWRKRFGLPCGLIERSGQGIKK